MHRQTQFLFSQLAWLHSSSTTGVTHTLLFFFIMLLLPTSDGVVRRLIKMWIGRRSTIAHAAMRLKTHTCVMFLLTQLDTRPVGCVCEHSATSSSTITTIAKVLQTTIVIARSSLEFVLCAAIEASENICGRLFSPFESTITWILRK